MLVALLMTLSSTGFQMGTAPWCVVDSVGNASCIYYDLNSCRQMASFSNGVCMYRGN